MNKSLQTLKIILTYIFIGCFLLDALDGITSNSDYAACNRTLGRSGICFNKEIISTGENISIILDCVFLQHIKMFYSVHKTSMSLICCTNCPREIGIFSNFVRIHRKKIPTTLLKDFKINPILGNPCEIFRPPKITA